MKIILIQLSVTVMALLAGCSKRGPAGGHSPYLARVGNTYLTIDEARRSIPPFVMKQDSINALNTYRKQWIRREVLLNKAGEMQLAQNEKVQQKLKEAHNEVLINALQQSVTTNFEKRSTVSDEDALNYFKKHKKKLVLNERYVKFRHVETNELAEARRARKELQNDSSWTKVAHKYTLNPEQSIQKSNQIWPVSAVFSQLPSMKRYVSTLDSGRISPIQRVEGIYHFIQLTQVYKQGETANPRWFTKQLKEWLMREKQRNYYNSYVKNLYLDAKEDNEIELFNVNIPSSNDNVDSTNTRKFHE